MTFANQNRRMQSINVSLPNGPSTFVTNADRTPAPPTSSHKDVKEEVEFTKVKILNTPRIKKDSDIRPEKDPRTPVKKQVTMQKAHNQDLMMLSPI